MAIQNGLGVYKWWWAALVFAGVLLMWITQASLAWAAMTLAMAFVVAAVLTAVVAFISKSVGEPMSTVGWMSIFSFLYLLILLGNWIGME